MNFKKQTILFVDDDKILHKIIAEYLKELNADIIFAENGFDAYEIFKKQKIDLIVTDLNMPKISGVDLIKKIRDVNFWLPIVVLTSELTSENFISCGNLNIQGLIDKPLNKEKLLTVLNNLSKYDIDENYNTELIKLDNGLFYDSINSSLNYKNEEISLTKKERLLLELLIKNKNKVVSYRNIETVIWYYEDKVMTQDALKNIIKSLRKKISKDLIKNISGLGYKIII